jgi:hypothetical protein
MIGGIEETSASFEARSAPRSYPTEGWGWQRPHLLGAIAIHVPDAVALSRLMLGVTLVASASELMLDRNQRPRRKRGSDDV